MRFLPCLIVWTVCFFFPRSEACRGGAKAQSGQGAGKGVLSFFPFLLEKKFEEKKKKGKGIEWSFLILLLSLTKNAIRICKDAPPL